MSRPKTVLVLGAGASTYYGFPLGRGLRDLVCELCETDSGALVSQGFTPEDVARFSFALSRSGYTSVDWFLEKHAEFIPIGRAAIAAALIPFEEQARLFPPRAPSAHWYEDFFNLMWSDEDCSLSGGNHITILTFNYDRSLEYYLAAVASTRTDLTPDAALFRINGPHRTVIAQGPTLIHLHGQLGRLEGDDSRPYAAEVNPDTVKKAAAELTLLSEANPDSEEFRLGREAIAECDRLYFLGFGFHPASLRRLADFGDSALFDGKQVSGTNTGFTSSAWSKVEEELLQGRWTRIRDGNSVHGFIKEPGLVF